MKTLVTRSLALLLTLALLFTVTPFTALAEAAETDDWMDESMSILETIDEDSEEISVADMEETEDQPAVEEASEGMENIEDYEPGPDLPDESDDGFLPDDPDAPSLEDDWSDWYTDDAPEDETDDEYADDWMDEEEQTDTTLSAEEEIALLYEGSLIRYTVDYDGYVYVRTKQPLPVYRDERMSAESELCRLQKENAVLLATGFTVTDSGCAILVWFLTSDMEPVQGYVRESGLWNDALTLSDVYGMMADQDHLLVQVNGSFLPIFIACWNDDEAAADEEIIETEDDFNEFEAADTLEESSEEEAAAPAVLGLRGVPLLGASYTVYASSSTPIVITTGPSASMTGNRNGFTSIDSGNDDGDLRGSGRNIKGATVTVLGFRRYHHALIKADWAGTLVLTEAAYMHPVNKTYTCNVTDSQGNKLANHDVRVYDGKGNYVTTVKSNANGVASYTGLHLDVQAAIAFAEANYNETSQNVMIENNDCASFISECLTSGGFAVYGAYASNSSPGPGGIGYGLYDRLASWIGVPGKSNPSIADLSPGDVVFMHPKSDSNSPYGHSMLIGDVNRSTGQVLVYGHSTSAKQEGDSNKMWISPSRICYVSYTSLYNYTFDYDLPTQATPTPAPTSTPTARPTASPTPTSAPTPSVTYGGITIRKRDSSDHSIFLAGAVFTLYNSAGASMGTKTTDSSGACSWNNLPVGVYYLTEVSAPAGYQVSGSTYQVEVASTPATYLIDNVKDAPSMATVQLTKLSAESSAPLYGAIYELVTLDGTQYMRAVSAVDGSELPARSTNVSGVISWDNVVSAGDYYVHEVVAPTGYLLDDAYYPLTVGAQTALAKITVTDSIIRGKIRIMKTDGNTSAPLAGAEFTITRKTVPSSQIGVTAGDVVAVITTDSSGCAETDYLEYGDYEITETGTPDGYAASDFSTTVSLTENMKTYTVNVKNYPEQGQIRITKKDALDGRPLSGVVFEIYHETQLIGTMTTDENGCAVSDALPEGLYTVKEKQLPKGYTGDLSVMDCSVQAGKTIALSAVNQPIQFRVKILKTDAVSQQPLAGAEFTVTRKDTGEIAAILTTNANGEAASDLLRYGEYTVTESKVPENYINSGFTAIINGTENNKTYVIEVENRPMQGGIRITKTDALNGSPIEGIVFDIYSGTTFVGSMTTNASGIAVSSDLPKGNYTVREHALPDGYTGSLVSMDCVVKPNEIIDLEAENEPIRFKVKILKTDALTQEPVSAAEFTIKNMGTGETAAILTTDANGEAISDLLRYGKYEVTESTVPVNYIDTGFSATVSGTENGKTYVIEAENQPMQGGIRITKTDKLDGSPLSGVTFDIYQGSTLISSMTTNESGVAVSGDLPKGNYTVKERALPTGYTGDLATMDCTVKSSEITELAAQNQPIQFKVKIIKTDSLTKEPLSGAEFTITSKTTGVVAAVLTTDRNGEATSGLLRYGEYTVTETKTPAHYTENAFSAVVNGTENEKVYEIQVENEPTKGQIRLVKMDALDRQPIADVVFDIYQGDQLISSMKTNQVGIALSDPLPKGNYTVKEHENPEGYVAELFTQDCAVKSDEVTELKAENTPVQFKILILKSDALNQKPLPGAEFTVKRISGLPSCNGAGDGEIVATLVTNDQGEAVTVPLTWGTYEVTETKVPENFIDNHFSETVTGTENDKTYILNVSNEPMKGWIRLTKTDRLDGHPIAGVTFDILQDGQTVSSMTTDQDGEAVSEPIVKGKYTVKEHENPKGYTSELFSLDCEVFSDLVTRMTADNQPIQGRIKIVKKDELTGETLPGAEFTITRVSGLPSHNGEGNGEQVAALTTDNSGAAVSPLLTWGTYKIEETKVPDHYVDNHFSAIVVIKENEKTYEITAENEPTKGWIELIKTDALDRIPIAGVQFDIYYNDEYGSGLAATMTTNEEGVAKSPALRKGKYLVKEHADPTGYVTDLAMLDCEVRSDETTHISATNQPIQGRVKIIKRDELTKEALAGAEFTVTRVSGLPSHNGSNDGEVVAVITTDADGIAVTPLLTWGTYKVEETVVPVHYVDNHYSTEVTIEEENLKTYEVEVENEPTKGWIRMTKTDRKNGNPIAGVQFDIYYNDQYGEGLAATMTTGPDGVALSEPLRKGRYIVKEHGQTPGYLFEEITLECTVKSDEITDLTATNQPVMTRLKIYKRDKDEYKRDLAAVPGTRGDGVLTGTVYTVRAGEDITDRQGNILYEKGTAVQENLKTSGEEASVTTDELWPGVYEFVEVMPPTGYQLDETPVRVDTTSAAQQSMEEITTYTGVNTNEVLYGRYAFVKFYGDNQVHDDAGLIEKPETDAVFHVYLKSAGSYEAARKYERDKITTDRNGKAMTKLLPYGIYTVEQVKGKKGYAIKAPFDIFIRGTEDPNDPPTMIINNEAIHYRLKFIKIDVETGNTITAANTSFKLKDGEGNYVKQTVYYPHKEEIDTFVTDETGAVTLPETLIYGLYFAEEFEAPEGYLIATQEIPVFVGNDHFDQPGEAYLLEYKVENEAVKGRILLEKKGLQLTGFDEKTDSFGNTYFQPVYEEKYLTGAVFEIRAAEDITGKDGTLWYHADDLVDTITTTAEGKDASKVLPLGKYYLVEVFAPEGYIFSGERYEANLEYADDHTALVEITVEAHNNYLPVSVSLEKEMEIMEIVQGADNTVCQTVSTTPGKGFVFGLYNNKDIHYDGGTLLADTLVATGVTDVDGKLTFSGIYPHGQYYIKELSTLDGWKLNPNTFPVDLSSDNRDSENVIHVSLPEPVRNDLIYTHVTLTKTDITGQHTVPGALIEVSDADGNVIYRAYTDEHGEIPDIPVTPGRYTFREILAPEGYELNKAEMSFSVDKDLNITGDTVIRDDYTRVYLLKLDEAGRPLAGVEFSLMKKDGTVLMRSQSNADGRIVFEKIPYGEYTITESKTLAGYQNEAISVTLNVDGAFTNPKLPLDTVINHPIIVKLKKVDQDGKPLPGAEYALINEYGEQMMTAVSDAEGTLTFQKVPYGKYTLKETLAPNGYLLSKEMPEIVIDESWRNSDTPVLTLTNHLKRLRYIKVDTSGKYLPSVEFSLINASNGEVVEAVTSNERGEFIFTKFDYGFWKIRETKVPDGFNQMEEISFNVDAGWTEPAPFTCVNIPNHYEFVKTDNEGNPLLGVKLTLEDSEGNILRDLVSGEDGIVHVDGLTPGTYIIREIETLEGFTVSSEPIEVVIDEHYIVPDEMFVLVNYPDIQTGVDFEITPWMYAGGAAMLAGLILLLAVLFRRRKK